MLPATLRTLLATLLVLSTAAAAGAITVEKRFDATYPFAPGDELTLDNRNGSVEVEPWDRAEVEVAAVVRARARGRDRAEEALAAIEVAVEAAPGRLTIETRRSSRAAGWLSRFFEGESDESVDYSLRVPRELVARLSTVNGALQLRGLSGDLRLRATNGKIEARDCAGRVDASTTNGSVTAELSRLAEDADLELSSTNGGIRLSLPADAAATVRASTVNGSITTELPLTVLGRAGRRHLDGTLNGGGSRIRLSTTNGSIRLSEL